MNLLDLLIFALPLIGFLLVLLLPKDNVDTIKRADARHLDPDLPRVAAA